LRYHYATPAPGQRPKAAAIAYEFAIGKGGPAVVPSKASEREKRRAKALRENLRRRKTAAKQAAESVAATPNPDLKKSSDGPNKA